MNLWIISLFDPTPLDNPTSTRFIGIADAANRLGCQVTHFTSTFRHAAKQHRFEKTEYYQVRDQYEVVYTRSLGYKKNMSPRRFFAHWQFAQKLLAEMDRREKPDAIFISMPPLSTINAVSRWGKKRGVPVIIDIIDPWPDSFIKDVPLSVKGIARQAIWPFYRSLRNSFANCSAITAISRGYLEWAADHHDGSKPTRTFYLAANFDEVHAMMEEFSRTIKKDPSVLRLIYAGSLASSYDIPCILAAAEIMHKKYPGKTEFIFTGLGPQKTLIEEYISRNDNIQYLGFVSKEELMKQYYLSDIGLIQHKNNLTQTVTYKLFSYLSAGLPVLNSLQSEMATLINEYELGLNNEAQDVDQLVANIEHLLQQPELVTKYRKNALSFTREEGDAEVVYSKLVNFIRELAEQQKKGSVVHEN